MAGLIVSPAGSLLAACAGGSSNNNAANTGAKTPDNPFGVADGSKVDVIVFNGGLGDEYPKFDKTLFAAKHGQVTVSLSSTQKIKTEQQPRFSTTPADLINNSGADSMALDALINDGALADLGPLLDAPSWDDKNVKVRDTLLPGTVDDGTFSGKFYVLNYAYTVFGTWYNQALFDQNGWTAPKTFDEFFAMVPQIKAKGIAPFAFAGKYPYYMRWAIMSWIWKSGGRSAVVDIDNLKPGAWKTDGVTAALSAAEKLVKDHDTLTGSDTLSHTESQQAWLDGKAAFLPVGTWLENEMKATIPAGFKMKISNFWGVSSADKAPNAVYAGSGEGWIVPKKAANPAGGMEFLRAMMSKDGAGEVRVADPLTDLDEGLGRQRHRFDGTDIGERADEGRRRAGVVQVPGLVRRPGQGEPERDRRADGRPHDGGQVRRHHAGGGRQGRRGQHHQEADADLTRLFLDGSR